MEPYGPDLGGGPRRRRSFNLDDMIRGRGAMDLDEMGSLRLGEMEDSRGYDMGERAFGPLFDGLESPSRRRRRGGRGGRRRRRSLW